MLLLKVRGAALDAGTVIFSLLAPGLARAENGLERRKAQGLPIGPQSGAKDTGRRKRAGYVASWEAASRSGDTCFHGCII